MTEGSGHDIIYQRFCYMIFSVSQRRIYSYVKRYSREGDLPCVTLKCVKSQDVGGDAEGGSAAEKR